MKKKPFDYKGPIHKGVPPDLELRFSFKYFDATDLEMCPSSFPENYIHTLMERLKALSAWTVKEFMNANSKSIRAHCHHWEETSRPKGFQHLPEHLKDSRGWQFQLSSNEHGQVHGFFIGETFFIVWLDKDHKLYS